MTKVRKDKYIPFFSSSRMVSTISTAMVLFLVGVIVAIGLWGHRLQNQLRESFVVTVLLDPSASASAIQQISDRIAQEPYVRQLSYYSKEEAMAELTKELGENPEEFLGWNPLSPTFEIQVKADYLEDASFLGRVEEELQRYTIVQSVNYRKDIVSGLNDNIRKVTIAAAVLAILLLMISFALISNTIRLHIYAKRFTIYTMRLVGATGGFIRRPFVAAGILNGVLAALLAYGVLAIIAWRSLFVRPFVLLSDAVIVGVAVLVVGVVVSWIASALAVSKYLRMTEDRLYRA